MPSRRDVLAGAAAATIAGALTVDVAVAGDYVHRTRDQRLAPGRWHTLATLTVPRSGWVLVSYQIPLHDARRGSTVRVRLVRRYRDGRRDGTGDDARVVGDSRWNIRNGHLLRGGPFDLAVTVLSSSPAVVPYLVAKIVRVAP